MDPGAVAHSLDERLGGRIHWSDVAVSTDPGTFYLPVGTVTVLLADVEGSTRLWAERGDVMALASARYDELVGDVVGRAGGVRPQEQGEGDSFVAAFAKATDAIRCALDIQLAVESDGAIPFRVRMAVHTGEVRVRDGVNYAGTTMNRAGRLRALAHGGQVLVSGATQELVADAVADLDGAALVDLGSHRLRDLTRPEHVFQLSHEELPQSFPPLRSLDVVLNNLPTKLTSFIGREQELATITELVSSRRLVTLTGTGGCGKTRVALQAAADALDAYPDGVWFCDLAAVTDPGLVAGALMGAIGLQSAVVDPVEAAVTYLRTRRVLLVLDNCEHVVAACAVLADAILRGCPEVTVLATSREPLGVEGETTWRVPSLPMPPAGVSADFASLDTYDAVRLFVDRAARVRPTFAVTNENAPAVAKICVRLDGIPLAIELAAARVRLFTPDQIAGGLDDRFRILGAGPRTALPRQATLRASIDWSYELLNEIERTVLARLSVFPADFDLAAAEAVCGGDGIDAYHVLDLLSGLVDRSLVQAEDAGERTRYRLLETIRAYAAERLSNAGDHDATVRRLRDHMVAAVRGTAFWARGLRNKAEVDAWVAELGNLRAALLYSEARADDEELAELAIGLEQILEYIGRRGEPTHWMDAALRSAEALSVPLRIKVLMVAGYLAGQDRDFARAIELAFRGADLARETGDPVWENRAMLACGWSVVHTEGVERTSAYLRRAYDIAAEAGDASGMAWAARNLGSVLVYAGHLADAARWLEAAIELNERLGDEYSVLLARIELGKLHHHVGELDAARAVFEDLAASIGTDDSLRVAVLQPLAFTCMDQCDFEAATAAAQRVNDLNRDMGRPADIGVQVLAELALVRGDPSAAQPLLLAALREARGPQRRAGVLFSMAAADLLAGELADARRRMDEAIDLVREPAGNTAHLIGLYFDALVSYAEGDRERAEALCHEAAAGLHATHREPDAALCLELLGALAVDAASPAEGVRLIAAVRAMRDRTGFRLAYPFPSLDDAIAAARLTLGDAAFEQAWAEGAAMSVADAVAYARRGRGERKRPSSGWASLTPAELDVARLVAEGLTNRQIAERLFVAPSTVKTHLLSVFAKLGVSNRAGVAAEAARRLRE